MYQPERALKPGLGHVAQHLNAKHCTSLVAIRSHLCAAPYAQTNPQTRLNPTRRRYADARNNRVRISCWFSLYFFSPTMTDPRDQRMSATTSLEGRFREVRMLPSGTIAFRCWRRYAVCIFPLEFAI